MTSIVNFVCRIFASKPLEVQLWRLVDKVFTRTLATLTCFRIPVMRVNVEISLDNFTLGLILRPAKVADDLGGGGREECAQEGECGEGGEELHRASVFLTVGPRVNCLGFSSRLVGNRDDRSSARNRLLLKNKNGQALDAFRRLCRSPCFSGADPPPS